MKRYFYPLLVCTLLFNAGLLYPQSKPATMHADLALEKDEEDLTVFHHWIKWNNPGSLLINHLTNLANNYYDSRSAEIARLRTADDWIRRQKIIKDKLMEIVGPFNEWKISAGRIFSREIRYYGRERLCYSCSPLYSQ